MKLSELSNEDLEQLDKKFPQFKLFRKLCKMSGFDYDFSLDKVITDEQHN